MKKCITAAAVQRRLGLILHGLFGPANWQRGARKTIYKQLVKEALDGSSGDDSACCFFALTALLVEQAGFSCAYVSGASVSFTRIDRPSRRYSC